MKEQTPNWSVRKRGPEHAHSVGQAHKAYRWARSPWGDWTDEEVAAYNQGYDGQHR